MIFNLFWAAFVVVIVTPIAMVCGVVVVIAGLMGELRGLVMEPSQPG